MAENKIFSLVYTFLKAKDKTCAEIFKRSFESEISDTIDLPPLEEIISFYINKNKRKENEKVDCMPMAEQDLDSLLRIAKSKSNDLLTRIVNKDRHDEDDTDSSENSSPLACSSSSESEPVVSAPKRRRVSKGAQKVFPNEKNKMDDDTESKKSKTTNKEKKSTGKKSESKKKSKK